MSVLQPEEYFKFQAAKLQLIILINKVTVNLFTLLIE